jgi:DNA-binding MarR family transcriptional regulator
MAAQEWRWRVIQQQEWSFEMAHACYANRLRAASRTITRIYDSLLKPLDLKLSQVSVLVAVSLAQGELTIIGLADRLGMDRSTLSRNFDPLERRGLVVLGAEERHRARRVTLTQAGATLLEAAYPLWRKAQATVEASAGDLESLVHRLDSIFRQLA